MKKTFTILFILAFLWGPAILLSKDRQPGDDFSKIGSNPAKGRILKTRGIDLYYESYGTGKPMLLIHGNGGSVSAMAGQVPYFSKKYHVIAADSRSQGKSTDPSDSLSYEMMADDMNALLESLHLDSVYIIGWSDGGIIGLLLAIRHPEKVKKLAITGANIRPDTTAFTNSDFQGMILQVKQLKKEKQSPEVKNQIKLIQMMIDQPNISRKALNSIKCPTLVMGGDHDVIKPGHTLEIFQSVPEAFLWILPGSGHGTLIQFKDDFNMQVGRFFN